MEKETVARRFAEAIEAINRDGEAALPLLEELYHEEVQFQDPIQKVHGRTAFIEANRRLLRRAKSLTFNLGTAVEQDGNLFVVWTMTFEPKMGPRMVFDGATHITHRQERIVYQRDYWDLLSSAADAVPAVGLVYRGLIGLFA
jgi:ketosteroid isomerase-like protein